MIKLENPGKIPKIFSKKNPKYLRMGMRLRQTGGIFQKFR